MAFDRSVYYENSLPNLLCRYVICHKDNRKPGYSRCDRYIRVDAAGYLTEIQMRIGDMSIHDNKEDIMALWSVEVPFTYSEFEQMPVVTKITDAWKARGINLDSPKEQARIIVG